MRQTPHHIYQIPTKRPENITSRLPDDWGEGYPNVWLGVSVENQAATARMDILREIPAALRFISAEPLLGPLKLNLSGFGWVIDGGESGYKRPGPYQYRPAQADWFRGIRDQSLAAGIPYFHKQNGGTKASDDHLLDGRHWYQFPKEATWKQTQ